MNNSYNKKFVGKPFIIMLFIMTIIIPNTYAINIEEGTVLSSNDNSVNLTLDANLTNIEGIQFGDEWISIEGLNHSLIYWTNWTIKEYNFTGDYNFTTNGSIKIANNYEWKVQELDLNIKQIQGNGTKTNDSQWTGNENNAWDNNNATSITNTLGGASSYTATFGETFTTKYITQIDVRANCNDADGTQIPDQFIDNYDGTTWNPVFGSADYGDNLQTTITINNNSQGIRYRCAEQGTAGGDIATLYYLTFGDYYENSTFNHTTGELNIKVYDNLTETYINNFTAAIYGNNGELITTKNTTNGNVSFGTIYGNYTIGLQTRPTGYTIPNNNTILFNYTNQQSNNGYESVTLYTLPTSKINATFYDEITNQPITGTNISWSIVAGNVGTNGSTTNSSTGIINADEGVNEITYSAEGYFQRKYFVNVTNSGFNNIRLYLLNQSVTNADQIDYTLTDEKFATVTGAIIKLLRRYTEEGVVINRVVAMSESDVTGEGFFHVQKLTADYSFVIEYEGNTLLTTSPNTIKDTTTNFRIQIEESVIDSVVYNNDITRSITYDKDNREFTLNYNDPNNVVSQICFYIDRMIGSGKIRVNSTCTSLSTGSITLGIGPENGTYTAYSYIDTDTTFSEHPFESLTIVLDDFERNSTGIWFTVMLVGTITLLGMYISNGNPFVTLTLFGVGIILSTAFFDLALISYTTIVLVLFSIIFLIVMIRRGTE